MMRNSPKVVVKDHILFRFYGLLSWLLLIVVVFLVGWGIYIGDIYRHQILKFEQKYLGMEKPAPPIALNAKGEIITSKSVTVETPDNQPPAKNKTDVKANSEQASKLNKTAPQVGNIPNQVQPFGTSSPVDPNTAEMQEVVPNQMPPAENRQMLDGVPTAVPPVTTPNAEANLRDQIAVPIVKRIKALVDDTYASVHPDWIARIVRSTRMASQVYRTEFGIELVLVGVMQWDEPLSSMSEEQLFDSLKRHDKEGADILLGFVNRKIDARAYAFGAPKGDSPYNGAYGLLGLSEGPEQNFERGILRSIGHLFGAQGVADTQSQAYRLGSWMSDVSGSSKRAAWIDLENRKRILQRKPLPTWSESQPN